MAPSPAKQKTFQEIVSDAIIVGDLPAFKKCQVGISDIDRRLLPYRELPYKRKYNPSERYSLVRGPTMTMLAILCEQDDILAHILENKSPDLSVRVDGYTALHLAALIKDHRPLKLLVQYEWIQENINIPIELEGLTPQKGDFTTALHAAVSNRRVANVFLLISEFPPCKRRSDGNTEVPSTYQTANVDQRSAAGSSPLYIATYLKDPQLVQILLAAGADTSLTTAKGETPLGLAKRLKSAAEARTHNGKGKIDPISEVYRLLHTPSDEDLDALRHKFAPELIPVMQITAGEEEEDEAPEPKTRKKRARRESKETTRKLEQILDLLTKLTQRVERLEAVRLANPITVAAAEAPVCSKCGTGPAAVCKHCHRVFCERCARKLTTHTGCLKA